MQRATEGRPAYSDRRASAWQYWQSILCVCTCTLWGKVMGCTEGRAAAGCRLHEDTARNTRMARSAKPSAPTPAFALMDGRVPSGALEEACARYHQRSKQVNTREARQRSSASDSTAAPAAWSISASPWASETNAASNWDGAT